MASEASAHDVVCVWGCCPRRKTLPHLHAQLGLAHDLLLVLHERRVRRDLERASTGHQGLVLDRVLLKNNERGRRQGHRHDRQTAHLSRNQSFVI